MPLSNKEWDDIKSVADYYARSGDHRVHLLNRQMVQLTSELGEVADALIGATGANERKGFTHSYEEVADELGDIALTAIMTLFYCADDPELVIRDTLAKYINRIEIQKGD